MSSCEAWEMPGEMIPGWDPEIAKMMNFDSRMKKKEIMGRGRGYIIAAALGVLALAGLLAAVKVLVGVVG